ncbi:hypothetical protein SOM10_07255 [Microbacterium sp. CFBP9023]|uniref:hypothetical protein n=1 Tax=unclassified Microbacterium TaxID=2609290 RepID=UPI0012373AC8|nr:MULTISPECIES: hypothetical protein [unclassified Microbacterium]MDY0983685.1 hypothetical protein [Microbacterium sp. CFBP9023]
MASELASILVPIGVVGAVLAALCAIVAGVAIMRGAAGLAGGAVGLWIPSAMLSTTASFANQWTPLLVSGIVLVAMLVIGAVARGIVNAGEPAREVARAARIQAVVDAPEPTVPARSTKAPSTGSQPALAG